MFFVALFAVLAAVSANFEGGAPYVQPPNDGFTPRMRELLENCEGAGDTTRRLLLELRKEMQADMESAVARILSNTNITMVASAASQAVKQEMEGAHGLLGYLQSAVARMNGFFPQACSPTPLAASSSVDPMTLALEISHMMRSDLGGIFFIVQAWGFNGGCRRWTLMLPAFVLSPPMVFGWLVAVLFFRMLRAGLTAHHWFTRTRFGSWLCCVPVNEQPEEVDMERQRRKRQAASETGWVRRFYTAACNMVAGDPADLPPPPPMDRSADPSSSSRPQEEGEREGRPPRSTLAASLANLSNIFTI
jgi:hypothetical protein